MYASPVLWINEQMKNSRTLPGGIVHFRNLATQAPQVGPSFLGAKQEKVCYRAASAGFEHGAFGSKPLTFTPELITLLRM